MANKGDWAALDNIKINRRYTATEIAELVGVTPTAVHNIEYSAIKKLRAQVASNPDLFEAVAVALNSAAQVQSAHYPRGLPGRAPT